MDYTREIIKKIDSMSGSKSSFQVFSDWVKCTALSIAQSVYYNEKRGYLLSENKDFFICFCSLFPLINSIFLLLISVFMMYFQELMILP